MLSAARGAVALAAIGWAGLAGAQTISASFPDITTNYVQNAVTLGVNSSLFLDVRHTDTQAARYQVEVRMPLATYTAVGGSGPDGTWQVSTGTTGGIGYVRFTAPCTGAGLRGNTTARFNLLVRTPTAVVGIDTRMSAFNVTASVTARANGQCRNGSALSTNTATPQPWAKVLAVAPDTGTAFQQLASPAVIRWRLSNYGNAQKTGVTVTNRPPGSSCAPALTLGGYSNGPKTGTLRCTYPASANSTLSLGGTNATGSAAPATAVGTTIGSIDVGNASVSWSRSTLVRGRTRDPISLQVVNDSRATVSRVDVVAPSADWVVSSGGSDSRTFGYVSTSGATATFGGTIAPGGRVMLALYYSSIPGTGTTSHAFNVVLTPTSGSDFAVSFSQTVTARSVPSFPPDVSLVTVRSSGGVNTVQWTNPTTAAHTGVVVLKAAQPLFPQAPLDFVDYTVPANRTSEYVDATNDRSVASATDSTKGAFNYLVCNHDESFIYSDCRSDVIAKAQYASNSAEPPTDGWTDQLGGEALGNLQVYAAGRTAIRTNRGDVSVIDLADGRRALGSNGKEIPPTSLGYSLPGTYMPGLRLVDKTLVAVSADSDGWVTAINLETGQEHWRKRKHNDEKGVWESFTAGVSGASAGGGLPSAYQGRDMIFIGSSNTGRVLAIDLADGETKWWVETDSTVDALASYDADTMSLWVPTAAGVQSWALASSRPDAEHPPTRLWSQDYGAHSLYCVRSVVPTLMACVDNAGKLRVLDKATGTRRGPELETGASLPSTLVRVTNGTPGFLVGSADRLVRVVPRTAGDTTLVDMKVGSTWAPAGWTLSPAIIFASSGYVVVGASDLTAQGVHLYKRSSEDLSAISTSPDVQPANARTLVGPPSYDSTHRLFVFGTEEGRIWAIPSSSF